MDKRDAEITALAQTRRGYIRHEEALALGLTPKAIRHQVARGRLIAVHYHVYAVGHVPGDPAARAFGALLACGPRAGLSHGSAATVWGILGAWEMPFEVSTALDRRPNGIRVHHRPALLRTDMTTHLGLAVTTPAVTMLDIAPRLTLRRRIRALNELRLAHGLALGELADICRRFPRHPGTRLVRPLITTALDEPTRSYFEDEWPPFARAHDLTGWDMNRHVCGHRVDVIFLPDLLIVELDGWATHDTPPAFERDREQDAEILAAAGIPTLRITHDQFHASPETQAARIHSILAARRRAQAA